MIQYGLWSDNSLRQKAATSSLGTRICKSRIKSIWDIVLWVEKHEYALVVGCLVLHESARLKFEISLANLVCVNGLEVKGGCHALSRLGFRVALKSPNQMGGTVGYWAMKSSPSVKTVMQNGGGT